MSYVLMVSAVVAGFGLTALCAAIFRIRSDAALVGLLAGFGFAVPALIGVLTLPEGESALPLVGTSLGLALALVAVVTVMRQLLRNRRPGPGARRAATPRADR